MAKMTRYSPIAFNGMVGSQTGVGGRKPGIPVDVHDAPTGDSRKRNVDGSMFIRLTRSIEDLDYAEEFEVYMGTVPR